MGGLSTPDAVPRRLSKPRTNTSFTVFLSSSDLQAETLSSPPQTTQQDYFGDHAAVVSSQGENRSRHKSRSKIRAYLYGSNNEVIQTSSDEGDGQSTFAGAARDVRKRLSRTGSSTVQLQSAKASTTYPSSSSSSRLLLNGSQSSDVEESAFIADQIKERAYHDSLAAQNHVTSPTHEDRHVDSVVAPLRRKSLYTPGLATRNPSDILKKPPQPEKLQSRPDRDYYYDPARPKESPLSQLAALHLGEDGRSTPSNIHYPQLGGLQLGTLRVTNGTASPIPRNYSPDLICRSPTIESKSQDEYDTASEGNIAGELCAVIPSRRGSPLRFERRGEPSIQSNHQGNITPRGSFSFKTPDLAASMAHEYMSEFGGSPFSLSDTPTSRGVVTASDGSFEDEGLVIPQVDDPAAAKWRQFIDDSQKRHLDNGTQEDAFRRLNGNTPSISESHRLSVPASTTSRYSIPNEVTKTDSGYGSNASLNVNQMAAQSGIIGARSLGVEPESRLRAISGPQDMPQFLPEQGRYSVQPVGRATLPYSFSVVPQNHLSAPPVHPQQEANPIRSSARSSSSVPIRKLQKPRPKSQPPPANSITVQGYRDLTQAHIPRVPSIIAARHAERLRQFPALDYTYPSSLRTTAEESKFPNGSSSGAYPLLVRFPSPANALEAATKSLSSVPLEPMERQKSCFKAIPRHRTSTIVHVSGDDVPTLDIVRSPSWSDFGGGREKREQKRLVKQEKETEKRLAREELDLAKRLEKDRKELEKQMKRDSNKQKSSRSRSASRKRGRSADRSSQHEGSATIADFGTVTESLGRSPYDITTSMFLRQNSGNWHPHQISTAAPPRPKSTVGMDEAAAAESARARIRARSQSFGGPSVPVEAVFGNRDQTSMRNRPQTMFVDAPPMPALAAIDLRVHDLDWARSRQRSQSITGARVSSAESFNDRGGLPRRSIRPQSIVIDAPPVPALPSIQQVQRREAEISRSRPRSIIVNVSPVPSLPTSEADTEVPPASKPDISGKPRKTTGSKLVPDLWSNGSLEKKKPRSVEKPKFGESSTDTSSNEEVSSVWEVQRQAWSQRRKSAGEALLRTQLTDIFDESPEPSHHREIQNGRPSSLARASTINPQEFTGSEPTIRPGPLPSVLPSLLASHPSLSQQPLEANPNLPSVSQRTISYQETAIYRTPRPGPRPLAPASQPVRESQNRPSLPPPAERRVSAFSIPRKRVGSGSSSPAKGIERLVGRYDGGLSYGYEPGCGLGGSAGTRSSRTEASRKSVDVSRGFGLDLSDVPIFVVATPAAPAAS